MFNSMFAHGRIKAVFLFALCFLPVCLAQASGGPRMVVKEQSFRFGSVWEGEAVEHTFQIMNQGDETLKIEKVNPG